jgi:hypothetical protein
MTRRATLFGYIPTALLPNEPAPTTMPRPDDDARRRIDDDLELANWVVQGAGAANIHDLSDDLWVSRPMSVTSDPWVCRRTRAG